MKKIKKLTSNQIEKLEVFLKDKEKIGGEIKKVQTILLLNKNSSEELISSLTGFNRNYAFKLKKIKQVLRDCIPQEKIDVWEKR